MKTARRACDIFELLVILELVWLCAPDVVWAGYLDPGSGSILVQGILSVIAVLGRIKTKILNFFRLGRKNKGL